jgi:drug/metabolite transporter (DMT)-like permease
MVGLALLAVYGIWGSTYLAVRLALESFPPFLLTSFRFLLAGGLLFGALRLRGVPAPTLRQWVWATIIGGLLLGFCLGGVAFAQQWVPTSFAAIEVATIPLWTTLFLGIWGLWPNRQEWVGLLIGLVGVVVLYGDSTTRASLLGAVVILVAAASWAFGSAWKRHLSFQVSLMTNAAEMIAGGTLLLLFHLLIERRAPGPVTASSLLAVLYLAIFGGVLVYSAYMYLLSHVSPALATSYAYVNPAVAVGLGIGVAGEHLSMSGLFALVVILVGAGSMLLKRPSRPAQK